MALSDIQKQYGRILYSRGKSQAYIAKALGIKQQSVSALQRKEGWQEDKLPLYTRAELVENLEQLIFRQQMGLLTGEEEDTTRGILNHSKLCSSLRDLEETITVISARNIVMASQEILTEMAGEGVSSDVLEVLQRYHDRKKSEL